MESAPTDARFSFAIAANGRPSISFTSPGAPSIRLSDGDDPLASLAATMEQLKPARQAGQPLVVLGSADGYLLTALARHPLALPFGRQQCVYLLEPNPGNLLLAMMIHDLSGANGPIRQDRIQWFVGGDCMSAFRKALRNDAFLPFPQINLASSPDGPRLAEQLTDVLKEILEHDKNLEQKLSRRYPEFPVERLLEMTSENPPRAPRALLLTTRFSTVLQYSTADTQAGLEELGWEAKVVIEPSSHHTLTFPAIRQTMLDFDPDVIIQIDHVRAEHGNLFPETLPFLCWTQDHLPNLINPQAAENQGPLDFLLTDHGPWYARNFGYPAENSLTLGKLTRVPEIPVSWTSDGPDLCYVSNAAKLPELAADELVASSVRTHPQLQTLARRCSTELIARYADGASFAGTQDLRAFVDQLAAAEGLIGLAGLPELTTELFERLNNILYRQQALGWAADVADARGLSLEIYGSGWDKHPRFARYAKGVVGYGAPLEALTRSAKLNLQIVPYFSLHQRLLDGIAAGGFYLVRSHPADTTILDCARFLNRFAPDAATVVAAARLIPEDRRGQFEALMAANSFIADRLDAVELVRVYQGQGLFLDDAEMPPRVGKVSFASAGQLDACVSRFLGDEAMRREIVLSQRAAIAGTLSYSAGMRRVMRQLHARLAERHTASELSLSAA